VSGGAGRRRQRTLRQFRAVAPSLSTIDEAVETRLDDAVVPQLDVKRRRLVESAVETRVDDAAVETQQQDDDEQVRGDERRSSISSDAAAQVMDRAEMRGAGEVVVVVADEMQTRDGLAAARSSDDDAETARDCARLDETGPDKTAADRSSDDERAMAERVIVVATTCAQQAAAAAGESETAPVTAGIPVGTAAAAGDDGATSGDVTGSRWRRVLRSAAVTSPRCHGDQDAGSRDGGAGKFVVGLRRRRQ